MGKVVCKGEMGGWGGGWAANGSGRVRGTFQNFCI